MKWTINGTDSEGRYRVCEEDETGSKGWNVALVLPAQHYDGKAVALRISLVPEMIEALKDICTYLDKPFDSPFGNVEILARLYTVLSKIKEGE